jgi:branched-chain amino acid transport system permease protein
MLQVLLNGIIVGGIYALIALGFALIYSAVRFYHLAYGAVAVFGAYTTYFLREKQELNFFLSVGLSAIFTGILGVLLWRFLYVPLQKRKCSDTGMLVASFGLLIAIQNIIALIFGNATKSLSITDKIVPGYEFWGLSITMQQTVLLGIALGIVILFEAWLQKTKSGKSIRAVGENPLLAMTVGINTQKTTAITFFVGTAIAALGASLISLEIGLRPVHSLSLMLKIIIACIIGGMGRVKGAFVGGLILGIAENLGIEFFGANWQDTVAFSLLLLFLLFRPQGLFGSVATTA